MRIQSEGAIPRFDLAVLRRFVPALWAEWDALRFDADGWLLEPDTGEKLDVLRLSDGLHRNAGARYSFPSEHSGQYSFTLAEDDGRAIRGTLAGPAGSARIAIGPKVSASGQGTVVPQSPYSPFGGPLAGGQWTLDVSIGDRWSADGRAGLVAPTCSVGLTLGERWHATVRVDVRTLLLTNDVPGYAITLLGGREATVDLDFDPTMVDRKGDLMSGRVRVQRAHADGVLTMRTKLDAWRFRVTLHLHGRGILGRSALLVARPVVRRAVQEGLTEFWADLASQATELKNWLAELDRETTAAGRPDERLHRELWAGLGKAARDNRAAVTASPAAVTASPAEVDKPDRVVSASRPRRHRSAGPIAAVIAFLAVVVAVVITVVGRDSSGGTSSDPGTPTPRQETVAAFAGTDLQPGVATAELTEGDLAMTAAGAADVLTARDTGTEWNTEAKATASDGTRYKVSLLAADLRPDPRRPSTAPTFVDSQALGATAAAGTSWRSTTQLGPATGPPWYPSATNLTGHTLLIIRLDIGPGASAELRRLTVQLSRLVCQRYIAATRP